MEQHGEYVLFANAVKLLSAIFSLHLTWDDRVDHVLTKLNIIYAFSRIYIWNPKKESEIVYEAFILSQLLPSHMGING